MEHFDFNDAIKNVKTFYSPSKNNILLSSNNKKNINNNENNDFSFKKNLNCLYEKEDDINKNRIIINDNKEKSIYSKNDESNFSSGKFGTKKNIKIINDENINISNFSIFKESNKTKISSFDNYIYSSSSCDNMDFNFSNNNCINNKINEISPFKLIVSNNNNDNLTKNNINYQPNNNKNIINNKILLKQKRFKNSIKEYNQKEKNKSNECMDNQDIKIKFFNKKSSNNILFLKIVFFKKN
jgi:hypothetical protein